MNKLQHFIAFIKNEKLQLAIDLQEQHLSTSHSSHIQNHNAQEAKEAIKDAFEKTLSALETNTTLSLIKQNIEKWKEAQYDERTQNYTTLNNIFNLLKVQKTTLLQLLPYYTSNVEVASQLSIEIEELTTLLQQEVLHAFKNFNEASTKSIINSEENYKDLFDNANDLIHFIKPDGTIMYVNKAWMEKLEYEEHELKGKSIYQFVHSKDRERFSKYRNAILQNENFSQHVTITLCSKHNKEVLVQGFVSAKYQNGQPVFTRGIFRDITIQTQYEEKLNSYTNELMEREENLQHLILHAPDAVIVINAASQIILWNPKAEEIFGWKWEEVMHKELSEIIIPPMYREAHRAGMHRYLTTGEAHVLNKTIEITAINKSNKEFTVSLTISATKQGSEPAFIAFIRDITKQKLNEKELEQQKNELEQYTWLTSHDLREPLRKIITFSDLLLTRNKNELSENTQNQLHKIKHAGERMSRLIHSVINYSRITNDVSLFAPTNLNDIIKEVQYDLELSIKESNTQIIFENLPVIEAIPFQIQQLFLNLISNAIKYRRPDTEPIIQIINNGIDNEEVEIQIKDNGSGFDMLNKEKVFKLFHRLDTHGKEGAGIGLALCKKIVQNHKGHINVESVIGTGTTFIVRLPIKKSV